MRKSEGLDNLDIDIQRNTAKYLLHHRNIEPKKIDRVIDIVAY